MAPKTLLVCGRVVTTPDQYPMPLNQDCSTNLVDARGFSKIDLVRGHHQVPVHLADVCETASEKRRADFSTSYGHSVLSLISFRLP